MTQLPRAERHAARPGDDPPSDDVLEADISPPVATVRQLLTGGLTGWARRTRQPPTE